MTNQLYCLLEYDTVRWPFAKLLSCDVFKTRQLHKLHDHVLEKKKRLGYCPAELTYQDNLAMRQLMQNLHADSRFYRLYNGFMANVLAKRLRLPLSYSKHPKMRVHFPGTPSVSSFHTDAEITHRADQINIWMPFTDVYDTATLWVESDYGLADYAPVPVNYGQLLIFDGGFLSHGTQANTTEVTRISLDLRFSYQNAATREDGLWLLDHVIACAQQTAGAETHVHHDAANQRPRRAVPTH